MLVLEHKAKPEPKEAIVNPISGILDLPGFKDRNNPAYEPVVSFKV
jgi:hypothetical protein